MKILTEYLSTKLDKTKWLNENDIECIKAVVISAFIAILSKNSYSVRKGFHKNILKKSIDYEFMREKIEKLFGYVVFDDDLEKNGILRKMFNDNIKSIEGLSNGNNIYIDGIRKTMIRYDETLRKYYKEIYPHLNNR